MKDGGELLDRVFRLDPNYQPALSTLGDALAVKGEHEAAVAVFTQAIALHPLDAGLHSKLGVALSELLRFGEAEAAYRRALALDPDLIQTGFNLATSLARQGRLMEAEQTYRAVIERNPHELLLVFAQRDLPHSKIARDRIQYPISILQSDFQIVKKRILRRPEAQVGQV